MKTTVLFRMIVLVAMVFAGIANATVKAQGNNSVSYTHLTLPTT